MHTYNIGDTCLTQQSGHLVRIVDVGKPHFGKKTWHVERVDTKELLIFTEDGLEKPGQRREP